MADIRNWDKFNDGRWKWTGDGFERFLHRGCQLSDIDAHLESSGRHLFIESKHWTLDDGSPLPPNADHPLGMGAGQLNALRSLTRNGHTVWLLYGAANGLDRGILGDPFHLVDLGTASKESVCADLVLLPPDRRRLYLAMRLGLWQADADGRSHIAWHEHKITRHVLEEARMYWERQAVVS